MSNLPYVTATGTLETMLEKIKAASVPDKFSQDFVATKLAMKGGTARATIPFIKKMGLVNTDGSPTERYREFRNPHKSGQAIAAAMRDVYAPLFEMNEGAYKLDNTKLKGLIVEATGAEAGSAAVQKTVSTFVALKALAKFDSTPKKMEVEPRATHETISQNQTPAPQMPQISGGARTTEGINLSYTINLNLPATTDIEVFHAIFKSLKQHPLQD